MRPLKTLTHKKGRAISDSRLMWTAEAYVPSLAVYAVAKVLGRTDGAMKAVVEPLAEVFSTRRQKEQAAEAPKNSPVNPNR